MQPNEIQDGVYWYRSAFTNNTTGELQFGPWDIVRIGTPPDGKRIARSFDFREKLARFCLQSNLEMVRIPTPEQIRYGIHPES
jgi:hypothetical protein